MINSHNRFSLQSIFRNICSLETFWKYLHNKYLNNTGIPQAPAEYRIWFWHYFRFGPWLLGQGWLQTLPGHCPRLILALCQFCNITWHLYDIGMVQATAPYQILHNKLINKSISSCISMISKLISALRHTTKRAMMNIWRKHPWISGKF